MYIPKYIFTPQLSMLRILIMTNETIYLKKEMSGKTYDFYDYKTQS